VPLLHFLGPDRQAGIQEKPKRRSTKKRVNRSETREEEEEKQDSGKAGANKRRRTDCATHQEQPAERGQAVAASEKAQQAED